MSYQPPSHPVEVLQKIELEEALAPDDPRVDTRTARGSEQMFKRLATKFGLYLRDNRMFRPAQRHMLFFGHIGSGKTTERARAVFRG